jgi:hypothetical protein
MEELLVRCIDPGIDLPLRVADFSKQVAIFACCKGARTVGRRRLRSRRRDGNNEERDNRDETPNPES